eukprot:TRINITY_DN3139_c0_g1_i1.p1 TRINITY_DN3139_c0_g1~~TRINITY_DN3139_c0_g1_i1.p1  ORF type:complete len:153 (+),score=22.79 TRINITY_DN3139_c0_g1_i1:181-639(+)
MKIMVCVDGSECSELAFSRVAVLFDKEKDYLLITSVVDKETLPLAPFIGPEEAATRFKASEYQQDEYYRHVLSNYSQRADSFAGHNCGFSLLGPDTGTSTIGELICNKAREQHVDLILLGRRGLNRVKRAFMGSVSKYVLEHAPCDVWIAKG